MQQEEREHIYIYIICVSLMCVMHTTLCIVPSCTATTYSTIILYYLGTMERMPTRAGSTNKRSVCMCCFDISLPHSILWKRKERENAVIMCILLGNVMQTDILHSLADSPTLSMYTFGRQRATQMRVRCGSQRNAYLSIKQRWNSFVWKREPLRLAYIHVVRALTYGGRISTQQRKEASAVHDIQRTYAQQL